MSELLSAGMTMKETDCMAPGLDAKTWSPGFKRQRYLRRCLNVLDCTPCNVRAVDLELVLEQTGCCANHRFEALSWDTGTSVDSFPTGWLPAVDSVLNGVMGLRAYAKFVWSNRLVHSPVFLGF